ncbi:4Fe-4S dicluster-binding protein [Clostridium sp. DJ247]|uniref:4Fe-4S dicluster-binding protein n=1 Tax=Clostridium sp. DJ247 TaxID=2726188 RepID=UPI001623B851|nr:4Fe-4S dicluster-binding protein [Clostridium sp. DJ247]MBC2582807.1 4Fe-4S binding protein [Clostridium sp. DJ247]
MADLKVKISGMEFDNPVIVAAGPPSRNADMIIDCVNNGAGGVVSKTISTEAANIPKPCMADYKNRFLNTELWSEHSPEHWIENEYEKAKTCGAPLILGMGYTPDQIANLIPRVDKFADAYEISSHYVGRDITPVLNTLKAAKANTKKPIYMKVSPGIADIGEFGKALEAAGADGLVAINSVGPCFSIDIETGLPKMGSTEGYGWMSGPAIKPIALRHVYELCKAVNIPVFGVGGVSNGADVIEMIMAGAAAVQVCTQAIVEGNKAFGRIVKETNAWLDSHGYKSLDEIRGITIEKMKARTAPQYNTVYPIVDEAKCVGCNRCKESCVYQAIEIKNKKAVVDNSRCFGCGLCTTRCGVNAIGFVAET